MAHRREEFGLGVVGRLGLVAGGHDRRFGRLARRDVAVEADPQDLALELQLRQGHFGREHLARLAPGADLQTVDDDRGVRAVHPGLAHLLVRVLQIPGEQHDRVLADHFFGRVAERPLGRPVEAGDDRSVARADDGFGRILQQHVHAGGFAASRLGFRAELHVEFGDLAGNQVDGLVVVPPGLFLFLIGLANQVEQGRKVDGAVRANACSGLQLPFKQPVATRRSLPGHVRQPR